MKLITDSGVSKTLINFNDWLAIKSQTELVRTSKGFRPYGTAYKLPIIGRAHVTLTAEAGASITTWVYIVKDRKEQSLLGKGDGERLGIIKLNPKGAAAEVVNRISQIPKAEQLSMDPFEEDPQQEKHLFANSQNFSVTKPGSSRASQLKFMSKRMQYQLYKPHVEYQCITLKGGRGLLSQNTCIMLVKFERWVFLQFFSKRHRIGDIKGQNWF